MDDILTVHFVPRWRRNTYHDELERNLASHGVRVGEEDCLREISRKVFREGDRLDVVHLHDLPQFGLTPRALRRFLMFWLRVVRLQRRGIKVVWTIHNLTHHESAHPRISMASSRLLLRLADSVIVHSRSARRTVEEHWKARRDQVHIIPHGNYVEAYTNTISGKAAREKLGVPTGKTVFLFLGNIRPYKGVLPLVKVFRELPERDVHLIIAGDPITCELGDEVERSIAGCTHIDFRRGFVGDDEIQDYMNASDVVVFPYTKTLTSGALVLAMSFGRACVAPAMGAIEDTLDEEGGFRYPPASEEGLRDALAAALEHRDRLEEMGRHNRDRAEQWDWDGIARMTAEVFRASLAGEEDRGGAEPVPGRRG